MTVVTRCSVGLSFLSLLAGGCGDSVGPSRPMPVRAVTVQELRAEAPSVSRTMTGEVSLYRQEEVGFEVAGRVLSVLDEGIEVRGPAFDETGAMVRRGDAIATLEHTRYAAKVKALEARQEVARQELKETQAQMTLAEQSLARQLQVLAEGAGMQQAVDDAQSAVDQAAARVQARRSTMDDIAEHLRRAHEDFEDTTLYAPFNGRITRSHVGQGVVVAAGDRAVTLTLMDPVQVRVQVSADDERAIQTGVRAQVFPKDPVEASARVPVNAVVYEKSAVADARLRTYSIELIVRNERRHVYDLMPELEGLPVINEYLPAIHEYKGEGGPLYVHVDTVLAIDGASYVLRLPGVGFNDTVYRGALGRHVPEKVAVELGDEYTSVIRWNFRSVRRHDGLRDGDFLIVSPRAEHLDGVAIGRPEWLFRPGDLVPVRFDLADAPRGFYVPTEAIVSTGDSAAVFLVEQGAARRRPVTLHASLGDVIRITGEGIDDGARLIVGGVHYLSDGQGVRVTAAKTPPETPAPAGSAP